MKRITWLHLTDLHVGMTGQAHLWPNVREALFKDLEATHAKTGPWSIVFFTGDLVQSGAKGEFEKLDKILDSLWGKFRELGSNPVLIPVPGNHDLQRPERKNPVARLLVKWDENPEIHEEFWEDSRSDYRKLIDSAFANYTSFLERCPYVPKEAWRGGILPGDLAVSLEFDGVHLGVIGLNTSFLQLGAGSFEGRLALDQRQLHLLCDSDVPSWIASKHLCILLTHHGQNWLNSHSRNRVLGEIAPAGRFLGHLYGHMHSRELRHESVGGGLVARRWQGKAFFGLEAYGDAAGEKREHGYSAGLIEVGEDGVAFLRTWPRTAIYHVANGWHLAADHNTCVLESDEGTRREQLETRKTGAQVVTSANSPSSLDPPLNTRVPLRRVRSAIAQQGEGLNKLEALQSSSLHSDPALRQYCEGICKAHGHIRFVEIPLHKDISDVEMDNLYVMPHVSRQEIHPDMPLYSWPPCTEVIEALEKRPHLVLLGDPGSGKSTLVSCLSWQLCRPTPQESNPWLKVFGGSVPLPMILRELDLKADLTWEALLDAFLEHRIGKLLQDRKTIELLLKSGRVIVLLDGLDEVGNLAVRRKLRDAIHGGMALYPDSRWILTSRIVGYDEVPFHVKVESVGSHDSTNAEVLDRGKRTQRIRTVMADRLYLAPFDDDQIRRFSLNWYMQHEKDCELVKASAQEFTEAIKQNDGTQRLARIPYLLTLMALIHYKNASLPHGRTELYERIATAYLESIDLRRKLDRLPYSLAQKKRWLAEVAYRMQLRRTNRFRERAQGAILVGKNEIQKWLRTVMAESGTENSKEESETLLAYFAKRSGLLLPRSEGQFAFMHLSLQEYFAACFLEPRLTSSRFSKKKHELEPSDNRLREWANSESWREAFVLLFELISQKSASETEAFLNYLFKDRLNADLLGKEGTAAGLLAELCTDPFVTLSAETQRKGKRQCWKWLFGLGNDLLQKRSRNWYYERGNQVVRPLVRESQGDLQRAWKSASITQSELRKVKKLDFTACATLSDLSPLGEMKRLQELTLRDCTSISDVAILSKLPELRALNLEGCQRIINFDVLRDLKLLEHLVISAPIDLSLLSKLEQLTSLHLHFESSEKVDVSPLAHLSQLKGVCGGRGQLDLKFAENLKNGPESILSPGIRELLSRSRSPVRRGAPFRKIQEKPRSSTKTKS